MIKRKYIFFVCITFLCSCRANYQILPFAQDESKPRIVLVKRGFRGFLSSFDVYQNGQFVGQVGRSNRYLSWHPESSDRIVVNVKGDFFSREAYYSIYAQQNKTYYLVAKYRPIGFFTSQIILSSRIENIELLKKPEIRVLNP